MKRKNRERERMGNRKKKRFGEGMKKGVLCYVVIVSLKTLGRRALKLGVVSSYQIGDSMNHTLHCFPSLPFYLIITSLQNQIMNPIFFFLDHWIFTITPYYIFSFTIFFHYLLFHLVFAYSKYICVCVLFLFLKRIYMCSCAFKS